MTEKQMVISRRDSIILYTAESIQNTSNFVSSFEVVSTKCYIKMLRECTIICLNKVRGHSGDRFVST